MRSHQDVRLRVVNCLDGQVLSYTICKDCRVKLRPQYCMVSRKRADSRPVAVMCIRAAPGSEEHRLSRSRGHSGGGPNHRRCRCARRAPHSCFGQARTALSGCARSGCHHRSQHVLAAASCKVPCSRHAWVPNSVTHTQSSTAGLSDLHMQRKQAWAQNIITLVPQGSAAGLSDLHMW